MVIVADNVIIRARNVDFYYGSFRALTDVSMDFQQNRVTALIGPSGCGKSTLLRLLNRMNDLIDGTRVEGEILFEGRNIYAPDVDPVEIRRRIGMVFQKPNPFPKSIYNNITYAPRLSGVTHKAELEALVQSPEALAGELGIEDILIFPVLRNLTMVRGLEMPPKVLAYTLAMSEKSAVPLYFDRAL